MPGAFSVPALRALVAAGHIVVGIVLPDWQQGKGSPASFSESVYHLHRDDTIIGIAQQSGIPIFGFKAASVLPACDLLVVACFSRRIPAGVRCLAKRAALNLHPSRLPGYRGPAPLFWQLRAGLRFAGVSLHHLTDELDGGGLVSQCMVSMPEGAGARELDTLLAAAGSALLMDAIARNEFECSPQVGEPSQQGWPCAADWRVPCEWQVQRAFNFMRGTDDWGSVFSLVASGRQVPARKAVSYRLGRAETGVMREVDAGLEVGFADGWLTVI